MLLHTGTHLSEEEPLGAVLHRLLVQNNRAGALPGCLKNISDPTVLTLRPASSHQLEGRRPPPRKTQGGSRKVWKTMDGASLGLYSAVL